MFLILGRVIMALTLTIYPGFFLFFIIISQNKEADSGCGENPAWGNTDRYPRDYSYFSTGVALNLYLVSLVIYCYDLIFFKRIGRADQMTS